MGGLAEPAADVPFNAVIGEAGYAIDEPGGEFGGAAFADEGGADVGALAEGGEKGDAKPHELPFGELAFHFFFEVP